MSRDFKGLRAGMDYRAKYDDGDVQSKPEPVNEAIDNAARAQGALEENLAKLSERMRPVLRPCGPEAEELGKPVAEYEVPVADAIAILAVKAWQANEIVLDLLARLAL